MKNRNDKIALIKKYPTAIAHLRQLATDRKLGVVLGAGLSLSAGFPSWHDLLSRITGHMKSGGINGGDILNNPEPMQAQYLHSRFRDALVKSDEFKHEIDARLHEPEVASRWRDIIRKSLYMNVGDLKSKIDNHPYLINLAKLCHNVPLVVSYNFDELLEKALHRTKISDNTVGYYAAWGPNFVIQNDRPVVYHPNGYIPMETVDRYSETVILTEESISDQIIDSATGKYRTLFDYFSKSPCLFIGFSLNDPGMRSLLRQTERAAPGTVHYYVHYFDKNEPSKEEKDEISRVNFELYNFVTLFMNDNDISNMIELVSVIDDDNFSDLFECSGVSENMLFHITGVVSVGKTSGISRLQGMNIIDEWLEERNPLISKPWNKLLPEERDSVDDWILGQVRQKNRRFKNAKVGIHVMDRAPLDAFAFVKEEDNKIKAEQIIKKVCLGNISEKGFVKAKIIFISGNPSELEFRQKYRGRSGDENYIKDQQNKLIKIYGADKSKHSVSLIDAQNKSIEFVTKEIMKVIFFTPYETFDFNDYLKQKQGLE